MSSRRARCAALLHLRDAGKCIVISSHIMQEVDQLADEIVIVARGHCGARHSASIRPKPAPNRSKTPSSSWRTRPSLHRPMSATSTVFRKELTDALRDRRTWLIVLVTSILVGPLTLFLLSISFRASKKVRQSGRFTLPTAAQRQR